MQRGIRMGQPHVQPRLTTAIGRHCNLSGADKPIQNLLGRRHRQFGYSHCAHTHKEKRSAKAFAVHFTVQPGCTFVYAQSEQTRLQFFVRDFLGLHRFVQQQRRYFLPPLNDLRRSDGPQRLHAAISHGSALCKYKISPSHIQISQFRPILAEFRPPVPLPKECNFLEGWAMPTFTYGLTVTCEEGNFLNRSFMTDFRDLLQAGSYIHTSKLGIKTC